MKKQHILTLILASFSILASLHIVYAQTSIAEICGNSIATKCTFNDAKTVITRFLTLITEIGIVILPVVIIIRLLLAQKALIEGNAGAYKTATKQIGQGLIGFLVILAVLGGFLLVMLQFLGVNSTFLKLISDAFVTHAYAQGQYLPNPLGVTSLYDFLLVVVRLVMSFVVYPAIIAMWVWSGFAYVIAQGNPEALKKAHQWLLWAVISTIVIFTLQGLLLALKGTVNQVLPNINTTANTNTQALNPNPSMTNPCSGRAAGDVCQVDGNSGVCSSGIPSVCDLSSPCAGKPVGTVCQLGTRPGHCDASSICFLDANQRVYPSSCYQLPVGTRCKLGSDMGTCDVSSVCFLDKNQRVLPASCSGLSSGTRCQLGQSLGTCDVNSICILDRTITR